MLSPMIVSTSPNGTTHQKVRSAAKNTTLPKGGTSRQRRSSCLRRPRISRAREGSMPSNGGVASACGRIERVTQSSFNPRRASARRFFDRLGTRAELRRRMLAVRADITPHAAELAEEVGVARDDLVPVVASFHVATRALTEGETRSGIGLAPLDGRHVLVGILRLDEDATLSVGNGVRNAFEP